jgi:hypothetical protein
MFKYCLDIPEVGTRCFYNVFFAIGNEFLNIV